MKERTDTERLKFYLDHGQDFICWKDTWEWKADPDGHTGRSWREAVDLAMDAEDA